MIAFIYNCYSLHSSRLTALSYYCHKRFFFLHPFQRFALSSAFQFDITKVSLKAWIENQTLSVLDQVTEKMIWLWSSFFYIFFSFFFSCSIYLCGMNFWCVAAVYKWGDLLGYTKIFFDHYNCPRCVHVGGGGGGGVCVCVCVCVCVGGLMFASRWKLQKND